VVEVEAVARRDLLDGGHLLLRVHVALGAPRVPAVLVELGPGGDRLVDAEQLCDRGHDLLRRRGDDEHLVAPGLVLADPLQRLLEDDRLDRLGEGLSHDGGDLVLVPALGEAQDGLPQLLQLLGAGPELGVEDLTPRGAQHHAPAQHPGPVQRAAEGDHRRLRDDRLVEVEEGGRSAW